MRPFLAMIVPMGDMPGSPPGIWGPTDPRPGWGLPGGGGGGSGSPPGIWGPTDPRPGWGLPGGGGGGGSPPGTWGGAGEPFPGYGLPGGGGGGIWGGGNQPFPTPPIVIPPQEPGKPPVVIWGGGNVPMPTPPIELPGGGNPPPGGEPVRLIEWKTAWSESTGWVVIGVPQVPVPTPSAKK